MENLTCAKFLKTLPTTTRVELMVACLPWRKLFIFSAGDVPQALSPLMGQPVSKDYQFNKERGFCRIDQIADVQTYKQIIELCDKSKR